MRPTIVIGSGDGDLCFIARYLLDQAGYETNLQPEVDDIVSAVRRVSACALLIDGRLPDAISTCEKVCTLRAQRQIVVVAVVEPGGHAQGLEFLNAGADEVFTRPVPPTHLVRALIAPGANRHLVHGDIKMDVSAQRVWRASMPLYLPRIEFAILRCFLLDPDKVFDRRTIIRNCWPNRVFVDPKTVNVHVGRLRKRLQAKGASDPIRSVRGVGYGLQAADLSEVNGGGDGF